MTSGSKCVMVSLTCTMIGLSLTLLSMVAAAIPSHHKIDFPKNCEEIQMGGTNKSGVYTIYPYETVGEPVGIEVYCDLVTDGGGWTVIQRRKQPLVVSVSFDRPWQEYANKFGLLIDNHWIGLDTISALTRSGNNHLRVELMDWDNEERYAEFSSFIVANASENYRLTVSGYSGNAGDSLSGQSGLLFSTKDRDNDKWSGNCAASYPGAWWFDACGLSRLNGVYIENGRSVPRGHGISWQTFRPVDYSLKRVEMKLRSANVHHATIPLS